MDSSYLEHTWDSILSRDPKRIYEAFTDLDRPSQKVVINHLRKMVSEEGWHIEQIKSARIALEAIKKAQ